MIKGADGSQIVLAPLESRQFKEKDVEGFDFGPAILDGTITQRDEIASEVLGVMLGLGFWVGIVCLIVSRKDTPEWYPSWLPWKLSVWTIGLLLVLSPAIWNFFKKRRDLPGVFLRLLLQMLSLLVILAIGLGLPAATVYYLGEGKALLASPSPKLFARLLQVGFIATASLMPVLLFFLFDRYKLNTLRNRLYHDLFRLDRKLKRRSEIDAKYGGQIQEAYGSEDQGRGRLSRGTRWPVLVSAFVVTMGWLAAFKPVGEIDAASVQHPLFPERSVLTFGFMGAYFFGLQLIARRYARGDLKPKAYGYITIRILIVAVLSWVLEVFSRSSNTTLVIAFLIGILPDELFTLIKERFRGRKVFSFVRRMVPESEKHPLTRLEGIDLYDRARLEQEGIVNVESFAHHDLIQLVLETRIPVPQLVDWMDQAILYLHTLEETADEGEPNEKHAAGKSAGGKKGDEEKTAGEQTNGEQTNGEKRLPARLQLRMYGIRTTTDLLTCWDAAERRSTEEKPPTRDLEEFKKLLGEDRPYRLEVVRDSLIDDEWLEYVWSWRTDTVREVLTIDATPRDTFELSEKAIDTMEEMIEVSDLPEKHVQLARLLATSPLTSLRNIDRSRKHARLAFELGKDDLDVLKSLIVINEANDNTEDALRACERAIEVLSDPKHANEAAGTLEELKKKEAELKAKLDAEKKGPTRRGGEGASKAG